MGKYNVVIPMVTGPVSFTASLLILVMIRRSTEKTGHIYHRLMFGISVVDLILSGAVSFATLPAPRSSTLWASGSRSTCELQGFLFMFGSVAAPSYFLSLQLYYLSVVKYEVRDWGRLEPLLHGVPLALGLVSATVPLATGALNASNGWCWVAPEPMNCRDRGSVVACTRGGTADVQRWVFSGASLLVVLVCACATMWNIYHAVRHVERRDGNHHTNCLNSRKARERIFHYFVAYLLTIVFPLINVPVAMALGRPVDILEILTFVFYPLQGLYNLGVFLLPSAKQARQRHPDATIINIFLIAFRSYTGPSRFRRRRISLRGATTTRRHTEDFRQNHDHDHQTDGTCVEKVRIRHDDDDDDEREEAVQGKAGATTDHPPGSNAPSSPTTIVTTTTDSKRPFRRSVMSDLLPAPDYIEDVLPTLSIPDLPVPDRDDEDDSNDSNESIPDPPVLDQDKENGTDDGKDRNGNSPDRPPTVVPNDDGPHIIIATDVPIISSSSCSSVIGDLQDVTVTSRIHVDDDIESEL